MYCKSPQIREDTDTKIELPAEGSDSDVIVITGHKAQVEVARDRIVAIQNEQVGSHVALPNTPSSCLLFCFARPDPPLLVALPACCFVLPVLSAIACGSCE